MKLVEMIDKGYRVSRILTVCTRALENDVSPQAGSDGAIAMCIADADLVLGNLIDGLERLEKSPTKGGAAALLVELKALKLAQAALVTDAGGNDPSTPEWDALAAQDETLCQKIADCTPTTPQDAAAMLEWCLTDSAGEIWCDLYPKAQRTVIAYLGGLAEVAGSHVGMGSSA